MVPGSHDSPEKQPALAARDGKDGARLDFLNLSLEVKIKKKGTKQILSDVSGVALPGELLFIMGPSGAGKTSLLDSLAGRTRVTPSGQMFIDGHLKTDQLLKDNSKYCTQEIQLYEAMTVRETLASAASFFSSTAAEAKRRATEAMDMLGLDKQADVKIGGIFFRGCSGGQKRRVTVGEQMVAKPPILFLDEPTSGLDSAAAFHLVSQLRKIARSTGVTVIASIHQPSERVFELSDRLLLLAGGVNGGRTVYCGPSSGAAGHFMAQGLVKPADTSLAEWLLDEINGDFGDEAKIQRIVEYWPSSEANAKLMQEIEARPAASGTPSRGSDQQGTWFGGCTTLMIRGARNILRNPAVLWLRFVMYLGLSFMIGTVWWGIGDAPTAGDIPNITGVLFFLAAFMAFMSISVLPAFLEDKAIFVKERANGAYGVVQYHLAAMAVSLPFIFLLALSSGALCHVCLGLNSATGRWPLFILNLFLTLAVAESVCLLIATIVPFFIVGIAVGAFTFGAFMVVEGFFIQLDDIPDAWRWMHYIAFHSYSFANFMHIEFDGRTLGADQEAVPPAVSPIPGQQVLNVFGFGDEDVRDNCLVLILMTAAYRLVAAIWSWRFHHGKK